MDKVRVLQTFDLFRNNVSGNILMCMESIRGIRNFIWVTEKSGIVPCNNAREVLLERDGKVTFSTGESENMDQWLEDFQYIGNLASCCVDLEKNNEFLFDVIDR